MNATKILTAFELTDRDLLNQQREIEIGRKERRAKVEQDLLSILRTRTRDDGWHVWTSGNRPRFLHHSKDRVYLTFNGASVVLHTPGGKTTYPSLEAAADAIRVLL